MSHPKDMAPVTEITSLQHFHDEISANANVVVYFYADWCPVARVMTPVYERTAALKVFDSVPFLRVNGDKIPEAKKEMEVKHYPETSIFQNGKRIVRVEGILHPNDFEMLLIDELNFSDTSQRNDTQLLFAATDSMENLRLSGLLSNARGDDSPSNVSTDELCTCTCASTSAPTDQTSLNESSCPSGCTCVTCAAAQRESKVEDNESVADARGGNNCLLHGHPRSAELAALGVFNLLRVPQAPPTSASKALDVESGSLGGVACTGDYEERPKRAKYLMPPHSRKPFLDPEPNCVIKPSSDDNGFRVGRANEGHSYTAITMWNGFPKEPGKVFFAMDFMPDESDDRRFESAILSVTFGHHEFLDGSGNLKREPIKIRDVFPTAREGKTERALLEEGMQIPFEAEDSASIISSQSENVVSATKVSGTGIHSSTVTWAFNEDTTLEIKRGLDAHYELFVVLPPTVKRTWMKFWAKAVLVKKEGAGWGNRVVLKIGSKEAPYARILDLTGKAK